MSETITPCASEASCGCVGYAFVPIQNMGCTYEPCKALERGSLFPELDLTMEEYGKVCKSEGGIV